MKGKNKMKKYEYWVRNYVRISQFRKVLNELGAEGWHYVDKVEEIDFKDTYTMIFEREIQE